MLPSSKLNFAIFVILIVKNMADVCRRWLDCEASVNLACVFDGKGTTKTKMHLIWVHLSLIPLFSLYFAFKMTQSRR